MTSEAKVCAICGNDAFFLICNGEECDVVCKACGVRTTVTIKTEDASNLVRAP